MGEVFLPLLVEDAVQGGAGVKATHTLQLVSSSGNSVASVSNGENNCICRSNFLIAHG